MFEERETVEQLEKMLELLDQFPEITPYSAAVIWDWLDNKGKAKSFRGRPRAESADVIIRWFYDRISSKNQGVVL